MVDRKVLRNNIEQLGFLSYVEPENLEFVREALLDNIIDNNVFSFPLGKNRENIDGRLFSFDGESLTEGGALNIFNDLKPSLEKAGLKIHTFSQIFDDTSPNPRPKYLFTLNNRTCALSNIPLIPFLIWALVAKKYINFLNNTLKRNKIKERIYLMNDSCSDTELAFLTKEQVKFIATLNLNPNDKVYKMQLRVVLRPAFIILSFIVKSIFKKKVQHH